MKSILFVLINKILMNMKNINLEGVKMGFMNWLTGNSVVKRNNVKIVEGVINAIK